MTEPKKHSHDRSCCWDCFHGPDNHPDKPGDDVACESYGCPPELAGTRATHTEKNPMTDTADWMDLYLKSPKVTVTWERYTATAKCVHCYWVLHLTKAAGRLPARARRVRILRTPGKALPVEELRMPLCRHHAQEWSARDLDSTPTEENP